jgi:hypothetical protein
MFFMRGCTYGNLERLAEVGRDWQAGPASEVSRPTLTMVEAKQHTFLAKPATSRAAVEMEFAATAPATGWAGWIEIPCTAR